LKLSQKDEKKKIDNISNQKQLLSHKTYKMKRDIARITTEKNLLQNSLKADLEIKTKQNEILEKTSKEINQLHLVQKNEIEEVARLNAEGQAEQTRISDAVQNVQDNLEQLKNEGEQLIVRTKEKRASHFRTTRSIAVKKTRS